MKILLAGKYFSHEQSLNQNLISYLKSKNHQLLFTQEKFNLDFLTKNQVDLIINSGFGPIIDLDILNIFHHKIINMHNSYLPNGRGIYPNLWSIFCKYDSGITICFVDKGIDTGDIVFQKKIFFEKTCTLKESWLILQKELERELIKNFDLINDKKNYIKQNEIKTEPSYHSRKYSEKLLSLFPNGWNSKHSDVEDLAKNFDFNYSNFKSKQS